MTKKNREWSSQYRLEKNHYRSEARRIKRGAVRRVEYFHQTDDPYSHLTAQVLNKLSAHYDIDIVPHLVASQDAHMIAASKLQDYIKHRRDDTIAIAPFYGLAFPNVDRQPDADLKALADRILAQAIIDGSFLSLVEKVTTALWRNDKGLLEKYAQASEADTQKMLKADEKLRLKLGYVYGSTFYYGGEWFLGVDRINYLEDRLIEQGARYESRQGVVVPRPQEGVSASAAGTDITLEFFPSVRSPYTAIAVPRLLDLVKRTGVKLIVRPVLPVYMRDGSFKEARTEQAIYVYADAAREARFNGMPYGDIVDCLGTPVCNCYSLFPWARDQGKGMDLIEAFTDSVFVRGVDSATDAGMQSIVERAGLNWSEASKIMGNTNWTAEVDKNLQDMYDMGLWGVPSFRLSGGKLPEFGVWGQDRLWLLEADMMKRVESLSERKQPVLA